MTYHERAEPQPISHAGGIPSDTPAAKSPAIREALIGGGSIYIRRYERDLRRHGEMGCGIRAWFCVVNEYNATRILFHTGSVEHIFHGTAPPRGAPVDEPCTV